MGGRGSSSKTGTGSTNSASFSGYTNTNNAGINSIFQQLQNMVQAQQNNQPAPTAPPVTPNANIAMSQMTDAQLAALVNLAKTIDMPNHIGDRNDITQRVVYAAGLNTKPQALDAAQFQQYLTQNNIPQGEVLARSVSGNTITVNGTQITMTSAMVKSQFYDGQYNYIGGKYGGQVLGAGTYFAMNGGGNTGYGNDTIVGVLSPNARVISQTALQSKISAFNRSHPLFAQAMRSTTSAGWGSGELSVYALAMGYNVIADSSKPRANSDDRYNVIDRSALIVRK